MDPYRLTAWLAAALVVGACQTSPQSATPFQTSELRRLTFACVEHNRNFVAAHDMRLVAEHCRQVAQKQLIARF